MADLKKIAEDISKLSLVDAVELKNILKDEYGTDPRIEHCAVIISFLHWNRFQSETLSGMASDLTD